MPVGSRSGAGLEMLCGSCGGVLWPDEANTRDGAVTDALAPIGDVWRHSSLAARDQTAVGCRDAKQLGRLALVAGEADEFLKLCDGAHDENIRTKQIFVQDGLAL